MKTYKIYLYKKDARTNRGNEKHIESLFIENTDMTVESLKTNLLQPLMISTGSKFIARIYEVPSINGKEMEFDEFGNSPEKFVGQIH